MYVYVKIMYVLLQYIPLLCCECEIFIFSLFQVKELGVAVHNCSCLALDIFKIFEVYWKLGVPNPYIPPEWPVDVQTTINKDNPVNVLLNNSQVLTYISVRALFHLALCVFNIRRIFLNHLRRCICNSSDCKFFLILFVNYC